MRLRATSDSVVSRTVGVAVLILLVGPSLAAAQAVHHYPVSVHIDSVLAADTNQGFDTRLEPMSRQLKLLFHYTTYRLVSHQERRTECGRMISFTLPGGRILHVEPRGIDGNMIEMEVILFQGERPLMTTDFHLMNHGMLLLGGPRYQQGMLIVSIGASASLPPVAPHRPHRAVASASPSPDDDD